MSAGGKGPYIQVALEALSLYPRVAMMAGIDIAHVHMGFNELWCHCFRAKVDHIPRALLAGFFPETPRLLETLVACGFVEPAEDGLLRVRGIEGRYNPTSSKAEAGRKGGLKTAAKAVREGGRFVKQPSSDQAERQAAAKHEESPGSPSTAKHTKQEPSREPIKSQADGATKLAPSSSREPSRTPSTTPSSGQAGQAEHQALNPKCSLSSSLSSPLRGESNNALGSAAPPSRAPRVDLSAEGPHGLTPPPVWPNAESEAAGVAWFLVLREKRPMGHGWTLDDAKRVALEFPDEFGEAATRMTQQSKPWVGFGTDLVAWLRRECEFVKAGREDQAKKRERQAKRAPGDSYSPRFRPEPTEGARQHAASHGGEHRPSRPAPPPLGRVMSSTPATELWGQALVTLREFLEPVEFRQYVEPLNLGGLSEGGELVLWCRDEAMRQELDDGIRGFVEGAVIAASRKAEGWSEGPPIVRFAAVSEVAA
ncbi:MAG TPA: hypothetical protein PK095_00195 [Myxococcota bacterium]|nr:hypothetical protein [Myxococcota bacterium]